jgi:hypothetical protein
MRSKAKVLAAAAAIAILSAASAAHAVQLFKVDPDPDGQKLFLDKAKSTHSSFGTVFSDDDIAITVSGKANFANGFSTIKPADEDRKLTTLIFTPKNPNEFNGFSFRGQDLEDEGMIELIIQDNQGHAPVTISFGGHENDENLAREGVIAALAGETIKYVEIYNRGGFKEAKQFEWDRITPSGTPEPGTWAMMLVGLGGLGGALRRARTKRAALA